MIKAFRLLVIGSALIAIASACTEDALARIFKSPEIPVTTAGTMTGKCDCVKREELLQVQRDTMILMGEFPVLAKSEDDKEIFDWQMNEWRNFGNQRLQSLYKVRKFDNAVVMQRSAHYRLYDHNIILSGIFQGMVKHHERGNLAFIFKNALFVDIGSAILMQDGAPTVRDLQEDPSVEPNLLEIVATDINSPGSRYVDTYNKTKQNLPFPVREVPMKLVEVYQFQKLTDEFLKKDTAIIFRSANAGPDLFYSPAIIRDHFRAIVRTFYGRDVLYFFNKFVLFKPAGKTYFEKIGRDSGIGVDHYGAPWERIDWKSRRLQSSFIANPEYVTIDYDPSGVSSK